MLAIPIATAIGLDLRSLLFTSPVYTAIMGIVFGLFFLGLGVALKLSGIVVGWGEVCIALGGLVFVSDFLWVAPQEKSFFLSESSPERLKKLLGQVLDQARKEGLSSFDLETLVLPQHIQQWLSEAQRGVPRDQIILSVEKRFCFQKQSARDQEDLRQSRLEGILVCGVLGTLTLMALSLPVSVVFVPLMVAMVLTFFLQNRAKQIHQGASLDAERKRLMVVIFIHGLGSGLSLENFESQVVS